MSDNEKDMEESSQHETAPDSKKESDAPKKEESPPPQKEESAPPQKPVSAAPVAKPQNMKEKDKQEQEKSRDEADDEKKQPEDDKKDDDTGVRKVTFDAHDESTTGNIVSKSIEGEGVRENEHDSKSQTETESRNKESNMTEKGESDREPEKRTPKEDISMENTNSRKDAESEQNASSKDPKESSTSKQITESTPEENKQSPQNASKDDVVETNDDSKKPEEKKDNGYVPLDQKWSSTKREFKGVQREYSFDYSRRSPVSSSSYLERRKSEERDKAAREGQTESQIQNANGDDSEKEKNDKSRDNQTSTKFSSDRDESREERKETAIEAPKSKNKHDVEDDAGNDNETRKTSVGEYRQESAISPKGDDQGKSEKKQEEPEKEEEIEKKDDMENDWRFVTEKTSDKKVNSRTSENDNERDDKEDAKSDDSKDVDRNDDIKGKPKQDDYSDREEVRSPNAHEHVKYEDEKFDSESEDNISVVDTTTYREEPKEERQKEQIKEKKEPEKKKKEPPPKKSSLSSPSPRPSSQPNKNPQRPVAKSAQPTSRPSESRRALSPAQMKSPRAQPSTPRSKKRPQTTPGGARVHSRLGKKSTKKKVEFQNGKKKGSEDGNKKQKEFFKAELTRLQRSLKDESSKIHKPKHREHYPFVWTSLEPYYNTYVARFLIDAPEDAIYHPKLQKAPSEAERPVSRGRPISRGKLYAEDPQPGYVSRNTAIGLCDPWTDLRMDRELLPRLETPSRKSRAKGVSQAKRGKSKEKPPNKGSTRLPKFPVVDFSSSKENATKCFPYSEVPKFRQEVMGRYKHDAPKKLNSDYTRTKDDFYRMDLDRLDEVHPINRPHMRKAYFAYLQNTPGSKKAIKECVKDLSGEQAQKAH